MRNISGTAKHPAIYSSRTDFKVSAPLVVPLISVDHVAQRHGQTRIEWGSGVVSKQFGGQNMHKRRDDSLPARTVKDLQTVLVRSGNLSIRGCDAISVLNILSVNVLRRVPNVCPPIPWRAKILFFDVKLDLND
jgi:hypothetical protein